MKQFILVWLFFSGTFLAVLGFDAVIGLGNLCLVWIFIGVYLFDAAFVELVIA